MKTYGKCRGNGWGEGETEWSCPCWRSRVALLAAAANIASGGIGNGVSRGALASPSGEIKPAGYGADDGHDDVGDRGNNGTPPSPDPFTPNASTDCCGVQPLKGNLSLTAIQ